MTGIDSITNRRLSSAPMKKPENPVGDHNAVNPLNLVCFGLSHRQEPQYTIAWRTRLVANVEEYERA